MATALPFLAFSLSILALAGAALTFLGDRAFAGRLAALTSRASASERPGRASLTPRLMGALIQWGEAAGRGSLESDKRAELRLKLIQAGFYQAHAAEAFFGVRAAAALALAAGVLLLLMALHASLTWLLLIVMLAANVGLFVPNLVLASRIRARTTAVYLGLPDAIDLMVVCLEAGATLSAAVQRVAQEFGELHPVLAEQFNLLLAEMQAGASRAEALARLAVRAPGDEIRSFTTMIIQSDAVGASLGDTLRVFADGLRKTRFLDAERKAAELPVKLAFPLVLFIFPCLATVIFIPVAIRALRALA